MVKGKMSKSFNWKNIKFDFSKDLNTSIKLVAKNIQDGIDRGAQFNEPFKRNAESTIDRKGFDHPLKETGLMKNAKKMIITKATKTKQTATLLPNDKRINIAFWNDQGTDKIPARPFWGISVDSENKVINLMEERIRKIIKDRSKRL